MEIVGAEQGAFQPAWSLLTHDNSRVHPFYLPGHLEYACEYFGRDRFEDCSLVVIEAGQPVLGVVWSLMSGPEGVELNTFGRPVIYLESERATRGQKDRAFSLLKVKLDGLLNHRSVVRVRYQDALLEGCLSRLGEELLIRGGKATPVFSSVMALSCPMTVLWGKLRKSYKSLINWGRKNLHIRIDDAHSVEPTRFEAFQQLHIQEAGRATRSPRSWEMQLAMIRQGEAFMVSGSLDGVMVTAALFIYNQHSCYYGVSASRRDLFDKPMSHAILWRAVEQAQQLGCRTFEMGEQLFLAQGTPPPDQKNLNISYFKKGFGGDATVLLNVEWLKP